LEERMKKGLLFLIPALAFCGLLLLTFTNDVWSDTMPHHAAGSGTASSSCGSHLADPTNLGPNNVTFKICKAASGATEWAAEIRKDVSPYPLVTGCVLSRRAVSGTEATFSCSVPTAGNYRGIIYYWVGTSAFSHLDKKFVR
jgi:hypothetical protein